ncbi:sugar nucleotide-binding protein [Patescibacteria group bacterium]|nr:sugar nucleotide-binding protein [Patescibacteria group bacterium]MBU1123112.1 sugar nucleotide-binding protein [Patescibacteria group bacterium]MBU1911102.1 sugar nucleotide-binding protein [Patescibacteria group bacterium]
MQVLIFGSNGYLGGYFRKLYPQAITPRVDISNATEVAEALDEYKPDVVINAAGKTGRPNVDWCEDHKEATFKSNTTGPQVLLDECKKRGIYWVHLGSGCIYQGDNGGKGFSEEDPPNFEGSTYSKSKSQADQFLKQYPDDVLVLRLRMPFDGTAEPRNLISKISKYERVLDVRNSITYIPDFMKVAEQLIEKRATGIYNVVNQGPISPYEIMQKYKEIVDPSHEFVRLTLDELGEVAKTGRSNCVLDSSKLEVEGIEMKTTEEAVREALEAMNNEE